MLGVVLVGQVGTDRAQVHRHQGQPLGLEPAEYRADEPSAYGVGLQQDERALCHGEQPKPWLR